MKRLIAAAAVALVAAACSSNKITWSECVSMCGGIGNVCEFAGDGQNAPDGTCVCKDKAGSCPGDAGAQ